MLERDMMELGFHIYIYGESGYNLSCCWLGTYIRGNGNVRSERKKERKKERERERVSYSGCYNETRQN